MFFADHCFVRVCARASLHPAAVTNIQYPTAASATWRALASGDDYLTIKASDSNYQAGPNFLWVIGVSAVTDTAFFVAATSSSGALRLLDGVPFFEDISQGQYEYFEFDVTDAKLDLTVLVVLFTFQNTYIVAMDIERVCV